MAYSHCRTRTVTKMGTAPDVGSESRLESECKFAQCEHVLSNAMQILESQYLTLVPNNPRK